MKFSKTRLNCENGDLPPYALNYTELFLSNPLNNILIINEKTSNKKQITTNATDN